MHSTVPAHKFTYRHSNVYEAASMTVLSNATGGRFVLTIETQIDFKTTLFLEELYFLTR
jgi:hypothetical protein